MNDLGDTTADRWKRYKEIFLHVADLPQSEQEPALKLLVGDDPVMQKELMEMLEHDRQECTEASSMNKVTGSVVSCVSPDSERQPIAESAFRSLSLQRRPGDVAGPFRLLLPLSRSSQSEVWSGESIVSEEGETQRVAIKFYDNVDRDGSKDAAFAREVRFLALLRHPSIAHLVASGKAEGGRYIATRFVDGESITQHCDRMQMNLRDRCLLLSEVCEAIVYAHRFLVVHRDLKPANIVVDKDHRPTVLDFGISAFDAGVTLAGPDQAQPNSSLTPIWASPEQVRGEAVTTATDVHALGLILYELVCGHHPLSTPACPDSHNLLERICQNRPRRPSEMAWLANVSLGEESVNALPSSPELLAAHRGSTPSQLKRDLRRLDRMVMKAMALEAENRYLSVADLRNDLINYAKRMNLSVDDPSGMIQTKMKNRPGLFMLLSAVVAFFLGAIFVGCFWSSKNGQLEKSLSILSSENKANINVIENLKNSEAAVRGQLTQLEQSVLDLFPEGLSQPESPDSSGANINSTRAHVTASLANAAAENFDLSKANELLNSISENDPLSFEARTNLAMVCQKIGRPTQGLRFLRYELPISQTWKTISADHPSPGVAHQLILRMLLDSGRNSEADEWNKLTAGQSENSFLDTPSHLLAQSEAFIEFGWLEGARIRINRVRNELNSDLTETQRYRAELLGARVQLLEGGASNDESMQKIRKSNEANSLAAAMTKAESGLILANSTAANAQWPKAKEYYSEALKVLNERNLHDHSLASRIRIGLAEALDNCGETESAVTLRRDIWQGAWTRNEIATNWAMRAVIELLVEEPENQQAESYLKQLESVAPIYSRNPYLLRAVLLRRFKLHVSRNDWINAHSSANELCGLEAKLWGEDSWEYAIALAGRLRVGREFRDEHTTRDREELVLIVRNIGKSPDSIAAAFYAPIIEVENFEATVSEFELLGFYTEYSNNSPKVQLEMIRYGLSLWQADKRVLDSIAGSLAVILEKNWVKRPDFASEINTIIELLPVDHPLKPRFRKMADSGQTEK